MASRSRQPAATAKKSILTPVFTLRGHTKSSSSISYFPDGKRMMSGSWDGTARRWDLEAGKEIEKARDVGMREVNAVAVSRDGRWVVMGGGNHNTGELRVCGVETGPVRGFKGHLGRISCIDISVDNTLLASGSEDSTVRIWGMDTGQLVAGPFQSIEKVGAVRFSPDSKKIAVNVEKYGLEVWDVQTQMLDVRLEKSHWLIRRSAPVLWTTKNRIVASFGFTALDLPKTIYEFDASTLKAVGTPFQGHTKTINGLTLSFDCALLASTSDDLTIKLWAFESRQLLASFYVQNPRLIIFSPDSRQLAYTTKLDSDIYLCNTPPEILVNIQPALQVPQRRTSAPINTPLADLPNSEAASRRNPTIDLAGAQTPGEPRWTGSPTSRGGKFKSDRYPGSSRPQRTDKRQQDYELELVQTWFQSLWRSDSGTAPDLPGTAIPSVIARPPPPRRSSPTIVSRLFNLPRRPRELLRSSSHTNTAPPVYNDESGGSPIEVMLPNLTAYITKDDKYPAAHGGFGEIWKCTYSIDRIPTKVAVKALRVNATDQLGPAKTKKIKRITRELRICAKLKHKNILPVYGYTYGFGPFIALVSPWAENGNLTVYLERVGAGLTVLRRFQILNDIIAGLQYLHANSVIHGDFTGPNVLIHGDGTACVADFGLSLMYSEVISAAQASYTVTLKGNVRWMAPELLEDREDESPARPSEQSDIFSFGGIMLQVLTNNTPYYYLRSYFAVVCAMQMSQTPSRSHYPPLPETYWEFIEKCWSTDPRDRPSTEAAEGVIRNEYYALSRSP